MNERPLSARLEDARRARSRLRGRAPTETAATLATAAAAWADDAELRAALPAQARLSAPMIAAVLPLVAAGLDADLMADLVARERGAGDPPALVAHVLASNVPALALPAIALGCLAGAVVLVKSGRDDTLSAPAYLRALAAVDPELATTVVATYWQGGDRDREAVLGEADVVVATGGDAALAAVRGSVRGRFLAHGPRLGVAAVARDAPAETPDTLARDIALYDQRGCLSPQVVLVEEAADPPGFATRLVAALGALAHHLPAGPVDVGQRAALRVLREEAEWAGATVIAGEGGVVIYDPRPGVRATCGLRTVRVHPVRSLADVPALLPPGLVECLGLAGTDPAPLLGTLRERGVSRVCAIGRMQRPSLAWPRGQQAPLGALLGRPGPAQLRVET